MPGRCVSAFSNLQREPPGTGQCVWPVGNVGAILGNELFGTLERRPRTQRFGFDHIGRCCSVSEVYESSKPVKQLVTGDAFACSLVRDRLAVMHEACLFGEI
jgi:hypothetical protein